VKHNTIRAFLTLIFVTKKGKQTYYICFSTLTLTTNKDGLFITNISRVLVKNEQNKKDVIVNYSEVYW